MATEKKASVEIDVQGAERASAAARAALQPWAEWTGKAQQGFSSLRQSATQALGGVISDLGRVVTVGNAISFSGAVSGVERMETAVSRMAVTAGRSFEDIKKQVDEVARKIGETPEKLAAFTNAVGRSTYNYKPAGARETEALAGLARESGRELGDMAGFKASLARMGVDDTTGVIGQLRANAKAAGTAGGAGALADQVAALSSAYARTSNSPEQLVALTAMLGKGQSAQQAPEVERSIVEHFLGAQRQYAYHFRQTGADLGVPLVNEKTGKFDLLRAIQLRQQELQQMGGRTGFLMASGNLGDTVAGAQFMRGDFNVGGLMGQSAEGSAQSRWLATPGGRKAMAEASKAIGEQGLVGNGTVLGDARAAFRDFAAENPLLGMLGEWGSSMGLGALGARLSRPAAAAAAGTSTGKAALASLGALGMSGAAMAGAGMAGAGASVLGLGYATGELNQSMPQISGEMASQFATQRIGRAQDLVSAAAESGGDLGDFVTAAGPSLMAQAEYDPALRTLAQGLAGGQVDLSQLPKDIADAVRGSLAGLQIQVIDRTSDGVEVTQPGGQQ